MAISELKLPGEFEAGKTYMLKGETLLGWGTALRSDRVTPGPGLLETQSEDGRIFRVVFPPSQYPPFAVKELTKDGSDFKLLIHPGRVKVANPKQAANDGSGYDYFVPEIDGHPMDAELDTGEFPTLKITPGEGVYVKINRDEEGQILPPVELVADQQDEDSDHYQPVDPEGEGNESQSDLIRILYLDVEDNAAVIKTWRSSDIDLTPFLWTGKNVGEGARVYHQHEETEGSFNFRSLKGCRGIQIEEQGETISIEAHAENIGAEDLSSGTGATILADSSGEDDCGEPLRLKTITQGAGDDERQIRVTNEEEVVRIHGNGVNTTLRVTNCAGAEEALLVWEDGLLTTPGEFTLVLGDCSTGDPDATPT